MTDKPVVAVIYTHTHIDHYGGVKGVVDPQDVAAGRVPIIAPGTIASFDKFAIGENVVAGNAMSRRASYAFNSLLDHEAHGAITAGIGIGTPEGNTVSYLSPTDSITRTGERRTLAGLTFEFLYAPDTEAPEEMHIWIPELKALTYAENANHSLHNIQTLRGARTRDARNFA
ncbi:MBL fold metallo-hydrolase, partial [Cellulomonas sp. 179-A 4D5 NHS]|uniref:MBL fold metallo-hydrolase n=1 Tax=Cellulomonas sp. 179-A 4D5 NHS TaxID=3142378 RepID=UPI0039A078E1